MILLYSTMLGIFLWMNIQTVIMQSQDGLSASERYNFAGIQTDCRQFIDDPSEQIISKFAVEAMTFRCFIAAHQFIDRTLRNERTALLYVLYQRTPLYPSDQRIQECMMEYHSFYEKMRDNAFRKEIAKGIIAAMFYDIYTATKHTPARFIA